MSELSDKILELRSEGKTYNEIKSITGASKGTISYWLGVGQKEKTRQRTRDTRGQVRKFVQELKQSTPCADCGDNYPYWIMEFDHIGDNKSFEIGRATRTTGSMQKIKEEIAKCEIVCANCHRNRTFTRLFGKQNALYTSIMDVSEHYASIV